MPNLGEETRHIVESHGYEMGDIDWVGIRRKEWWEPHDFFRMADRIEYSADFGWAEVSQDLVVIMRDSSWFERAEYDGSEWWEHKYLPVKPQKQGHSSKEKILVDTY